MTDIASIEYTSEAAAEIKAIPKKHSAVISRKIKQLQLVGWQRSIEQQVVKKIDNEIFEIVMRSRGPAWRVFCFQVGGPRGRIVVVASCEAKGYLSKKKRFKTALGKAHARRLAWLNTNRGNV